MNRKIKSEYEQDVYAWAMHTAKLLREKKIDEIDFEHVAEEIESMGSSQRRELMNRLIILIMHLLKWQFQSVKRSNSWTRTIINQRIAIQLLLQDSPSLRNGLEDRLDDAYEIAIFKAEKETGLDKKFFPKSCPFTIEQIFNQNFFPE